MSLIVKVLGAGREVGRSCIVVSFSIDRNDVSLSQSSTRKIPRRQVNVMFDCGVHLGQTDSRYPNFYELFGSTREQMTEEELSQRLNSEIDAVLLTHYHLDHIGGLPYLLCRLKYRGPVLAAASTRCLAPLLLADFLKNAESQFLHAANATVLQNAQQRQRELMLHQTFESSEAQAAGFKNALEKSLALEYLAQDPNACPVESAFQVADLLTLIRPNETMILPCRPSAQQANFSQESPSFSSGPMFNFSVTSFPAGHVMGSQMFLVKAKNLSVLYTGDYNTEGSRLVLPASVPRGHRPDLLISESTYASQQKLARAIVENELKKMVGDAIRDGGKVLIPVNSVGKSQELAAVLSAYLQDSGLTKVPIFFGGPMAQKAQIRMNMCVAESSDTPFRPPVDDLLEWDNSDLAVPEKLADSGRASLSFGSFVMPFDQSFLTDSRSGILFAAPAMMTGGLAQAAMQQWAPDNRNLIVVPGYCTPGSPASQILRGAKNISIGRTSVQIGCKVRYLSFTNHVESQGIYQFIKHTDPARVMFVHGSYKDMEALGTKVVNEFGIEVFLPQNLEEVKIPIAKTKIEAEFEDEFGSGYSDMSTVDLSELKRSFMFVNLSPNVDFLSTRSRHMSVLVSNPADNEIRFVLPAEDVIEILNSVCLGSSHPGLLRWLDKHLTDFVVQGMTHKTERNLNTSGGGNNNSEDGCNSMSSLEELSDDDSENQKSSESKLRPPQKTEDEEGLIAEEGEIVGESDDDLEKMNLKDETQVHDKSNQTIQTQTDEVRKLYAEIMQLCVPHDHSVAVGTDTDIGFKTPVSVKEATAAANKLLTLLKKAVIRSVYITATTTDSNEVVGSEIASLKSGSHAERILRTIFQSSGIQSATFLKTGYVSPSALAKNLQTFLNSHSMHPFAGAVVPFLATTNVCHIFSCGSMLLLFPNSRSNFGNFKFMVDLIPQLSPVLKFSNSESNEVPFLLSWNVFDDSCGQTHSSALSVLIASFSDP